MKKRLLSMLLAVLMLAGIMTVGMTSAGAEDTLPFTDVGADEWFYGAVKYVYDNSLMVGTTATKFEPKTTVTRAMFVTILGRLYGAEPEETDAFPDIEKNSWYSGYVGWASDSGIFTGFPDKTFRPNESLTRDQMAAVVTRYVQYIGISPVRDPDAPATFADSQKIAEWVEEYVDYMRTYGLVKGDDAGNFNPAGTLSRAEAATIVQRLHEMVEYLRIEEPVTPSYIVEGKDFNLIGAWDLYYSGTAVTTSYNGTAVKDGLIPTLVGDDDGRKPLHFYEVPDNGIKSPVYFGIDLNVLGFDMQKFTDYGIVRIGYKTTDSYDVKIALNNQNISERASYGDENGYAGIRYVSYDFRADIQGSKLPFNGNQNIISLELDKDVNDIEIAYVAMFKSEADAKNFKLSDYADSLKTYEGADIDFTEMDEKTYNEYMALIDEKRDAIINNDDDIDPATISGTCYYISTVNGDDSNDGLSPETAWQSTTNLYVVKGGGYFIESTLSPGDAVLFERGSVFNASEPGCVWHYGETDAPEYGLSLVDGVTYGAYGEGDKPLITCALKTGSATGTWKKTAYKNVWELDMDLSTQNDIGNIVLRRDGIEGWGVRVVPNNPDEPFAEGSRAENDGMVTNGFGDVYLNGDFALENPGSLTNNLQFLHDPKAQKLYLYCKDGNPADVFDEIVISGNGLVGADKDYADRECVVDNLAFKYLGGGGISIGDVTGFTIQNCEFGWIGGTYLGGNLRAGNAIQNWGSCDGFYVRNCYIYQIYDTGITSQGTGAMINIEFSGNVIETCNMNVEFWNGNGEGDRYENVFIKNNYERYAGYGFGHYRPVGSKSGTFLLGSKNWVTPTKNMVVEGNINMSCPMFAINTAGIARGDHAEGVIFRNNTYFMNTKLGYLARTINNMIDQTGNNKTFIPYTEQFIQYFADLGIERGTKFYYYDDVVFEEENSGAFY